MLSTAHDNGLHTPPTSAYPANVNTSVSSSTAIGGDGPPFPFHRLIPKRETGADVFVQNYPDFDGRGITIAIIDSGVDPGAAGLEQTTTGKPKLIDVRDFSGSGDIDTTKIVTLLQNADSTTENENVANAASGTWYVNGVSGRQLLFPDSWPRPKDNAKIHVGIVKLYDLASPDIQKEWKQKRKEHVWAPQHANMHAVVMEGKKNLISSPGKNGAENTTQGEHEEADAALEVLDWFDKKFNDYGPIFDVMCYKDESETWRAAIDTSRTGDLNHTTLLTNFRDEQKYGTVGGIYQLNYVINILCDGNKLEIVVPQSHGTHVASIAAACFPEQSDRNGIAPGAQIVSLKIGHSLLDGSFETGYSLVRAIDYCCKNNIVLANVSYGEPYSWADGGCVHEAIERAVRDYGVIICVAAGNEGPCLNTILSMPANLWTFAVAAWVTPEMGILYGLSHKNFSPKPYNWTSRAPSLEHGNPILCCAPGAAEASVPTYYLTKSELMNGTSMASPNACANVALILSGLKSLSITWSPCSVRKAIMNTSHFDSRYMDRLTCGNGLIKPCNAFEWLKKYASDPDCNVEFQCSIGRYRGICVRYRPALIDQVYSVIVNSLFSRINHESEQHKFELPCRLECDASWLTIPEQLTLTNGPRPFKVELYAASRLKSAGIHYAEICAYDARNYHKGLLFKVPVTVIVPHYRQEWNVSIRNVIHQPGIPVRHFLDIPSGATYADIDIKLCGCDEENSGPPDANATVNFELGIMQAMDKLHFRSAYAAERLSLGCGRIVRYSMAVSDRLSFLELATVMFWSRMYHARIDIDVNFHGLSPLSNVITFNEGDRYYRLDLLSGARMETLSPAASLSFLVMPVKPFESHIEAVLEERDTAPDRSPMFALNLFYKFTLSKSSHILVICPLLMDYLYENEFHSQLWKVFDARKVRVAVGDAKIARRHDYAVKLEKGDYTIVMQVRHRNRARLAKLDELPVYVRIKLPTPLQLELYNSYLDALRDDPARKVTTKPVMPHSTVSCFVSHLPTDKLPKQLHSGNYLEGQLHLVKEFAAATTHAGKNVTSLPLRYYGYESRKGKGGAGIVTVAAAAATNHPQEQQKSDETSVPACEPPIAPGMSEAADSSLTVAPPPPPALSLATRAQASTSAGDAERLQEEAVFGAMITLFDKASSISDVGVLRRHYDYMLERFLNSNKNNKTSEHADVDAAAVKKQQKIIGETDMAYEKLTITLAHSYLAALFGTSRAQFPLSTTVAQHSALRLHIKSTRAMQEALAMCEQIISSIEQAEVLAYMGARINNNPTSATKAGGSSLACTTTSSSSSNSSSNQTRDALFELKKAALIDALLYKGHILASSEYFKLQNDANSEGVVLKAVDDIMEQLSRYVDSKDARVVALAIQQARMRKQPRKCLKLCTQLYDENATEEVHQLILDMLAVESNVGGDLQFLLEWWRDAKAATFAPSWEPF